jgi:hypothetical protein
MLDGQAFNNSGDSYVQKFVTFCVGLQVSRGIYTEAKERGPF